jgi:hypothetical protein
MFWAFEQGKAAERGEIEHLYDKRDEAADLGTQTHDAVERHIKGEEQDISELPNEVQTAFYSYIKWESVTNIKIVEQEINLFSEEHQFGGTPDGIGEIDGELCLIDWKTSKGVYPDFLMQLAAYKQLWDENFPNRPITGGFHLCKFGKEFGNFSHHYWPDLDLAWKQFKLLLKAYDNDKILKAMVK